MARPKAFDHDLVLDRAMRLFWHQGYAATSIQDLVEATGINRASMYAAFGDKRRLYLAALERYGRELGAARLAKLCGTGSAKTAIRQYFEDLISFAAGDGRRLGCLLTNSAVELAPHDAVIAKILTANLGQVETALAAAIRRGQDQGEIDQTKDSEALAAYLLTLVQGLRVLSRADRDVLDLRRTIDLALAVLD